MKKIWISLRPVLVCFLIMTVLCGVIYPGVVTVIAQAAFPSQANGSMITVTKLVVSALRLAAGTVDTITGGNNADG